MEEVVGSNPTRSTKIPKINILALRLFKRLKSAEINNGKSVSPSA
jgi:hypothetical protein